jgi:putative transposase
MATSTTTLKLPFYRLNKVKAAEFERLTAVNTELANDLLSIPKKERKGLTTASFPSVEIASGWINQTIRNCNAKTKVKQFRRMWLETNNQNYEISKQGKFYTVAFNLFRGRKGRVPLNVHEARHADTLNQILAGEAKLGSIKICKSEKGVWYVLISVSLEVPDPKPVVGWIGVDRGQNNLAVAAIPDSFAKFWKGGPVKALRRQYAKLRKSLQEAKKLSVVKRLERRERRIMTHINHVISKQLVQLAKDFGMGLRFEDLSGIRQTSKQRKKTKSDAGQNRDTWAYYQLEQFTQYKAIRAGVPFEKIPPAYTSKSDHRNGVIGKRSGHWFTGFDGYRCNADWNAAQVIGRWLGFSCPLDLQKAVSAMGIVDSADGRHDTAP